jgi:ABC-type sulfate transport system permease component
MGTLQWAGTAAAALIAIGTVLRWTLRRLVRGARWVAAVIELPETVDRLSLAVGTLTTSVDVLSRSVNGLSPATEEQSHAVLSL